MGRLADAKLEGAYVVGSDVPAWDLKYGGQQGWGMNFPEIISNQAHVNRPLFCVLLRAPKIFNYLPQGSKFIEGLKAFFEVHALTITGFDEELKADFAQHRVGGNEQFLDEVVNMTREQPKPEIGAVDKYGRPIQHLLEWWMRYGMMDENTNFPMISTLKIPELRDMGPDMYTATCLFFEPDVLFKGVSRAWIVANMMPHTTGTSTAQRDYSQGQEILNLSIPFTGLAQSGPPAKKLAARIMRDINILDADPYFRDSGIQGISPDVRAAGDADLKNSIERTGKEAVARVR